jgi:ParB family transcriptional regulator, chromosome partitioning protein
MDLPREAQQKDDSSRAGGGKRKALGRGLSALITETTPLSAPGEKRVPVSEVRPNPKQPRRTFDEAKIAELAESIRQKGVLQPLVVKKVDEGYELIIGERRLRAAQKIGLDKVPVVVREASSTESLEIALIENIQREELTPIEEALAYRQLMEELHLTQEEVAVRVGKSRPVVTNLLRVLNLPDEVRAEVDRGTISVGHARALLTLDSPAKQISLTQEVIRRGLSVRETETLVARAPAKAGAYGHTPLQGTQPSPDVHIKALEEDLTRMLGTKVRIHLLKKGGRVEIEYYSDEELEGLIKRLKG